MAYFLWDYRYYMFGLVCCILYLNEKEHVFYWVLFIGIYYTQIQTYSAMIKTVQRELQYCKQWINKNRNVVSHSGRLRNRNWCLLLSSFWDLNNPLLWVSCFCFGEKQKNHTVPCLKSVSHLQFSEVLTWLENVNMSRP